jgi:hypothetical protein
MFVNDNLDVDTLGCRLSSKPCRGPVNSPIELGAVNHIVEPSYPVERKTNLSCASSMAVRTTRRGYASC